AALTNLNICNYSKIFDVTKKFKEVFQPRRESLQQIAEKGTNSALKELQSKLREKPLNFETAGSLMKRLPRYLIQDRVANGDKSKLATRARVLAETELKEIDDVTNKLHIVEAELIHRVHLADKDAERNGKAGSIDDG